MVPFSRMSCLSWAVSRTLTVRVICLAEELVVSSTRTRSEAAPFLVVIRMTPLAALEP